MSVAHATILVSKALCGAFENVFFGLEWRLMSKTMFPNVTCVWLILRPRLRNRSFNTKWSQDHGPSKSLTCVSCIGGPCWLLLIILATTSKWRVSLLPQLKLLFASWRPCLRVLVFLRSLWRIMGHGFRLTSFKYLLGDAWSFNYVTTSPRYPQSNGKVENAVRTVKRLFENAKKPVWQNLSSSWLANYASWGDGYQPGTAPDGTSMPYVTSDVRVSFTTKLLFAWLSACFGPNENWLHIVAWRFTMIYCASFEVQLY